VSDDAASETDFSALAASLQSDARDAAVFFRVMCTALTDALPDNTTVEHDHSMFKNRRLARRVTVQLGDDTFVAELAQQRVICHQSHAVHGVGGGLPTSGEMDVAGWTAALLTSAAQAARTRNAAVTALRSMTS